ncbi:MAG: hypothetical protein NT154_08650 [Verrucomicrobia bacterium]|nr:hypothetical protein [Verrucomicrobiota bacterium]
MHVPLDGLRAILEGAVAVVKQSFEVRLVAGKVTEGIAVLEREGERVEGVVKAQQMDWAGDATSRTQGSEGVGGSPEADIPHDEFALVVLQALDQAQLANIQRLRFGDRADHGMKGLVMGEGMDAVRAVGELNESVSGGGLHRKNLPHAAALAKLKELACQPVNRSERAGAREDACPP